ncbi:MAG TPA: TonB-dependent receptor [Caulobacter sp.]|nr:TonB-dependent receptor [Caulobacter sp.]
MKTMWKAMLLAGAAWSAASVGAYAQDVPSEGVDVEEVVVTARRREENLKDVPVAVSAVSEAALERSGGTDITIIQQVTPNATVQVARGSNSTLISFIRGVGQQDPLWGFEPGVGLYIDDVYVARPQGAVLDVFDIQRIEVLRGPQGTLYGRNTIGGAIKYVTKRLGDEPTVTLKGAYGSYNQIDLMASGSVPIGETFAIGGAIARYTRDGFGENLNTGAEHYDKDVTAARVSAEWTPSGNLFFRLAGDWVQDDSAPRHGYREVQALNSAGVPIAGGAPLGDKYDTRAGVGDSNDVRTRGLSFTAQWDINDTLTFKSITAYRDGDTETVIDFDGLPQPILDIPAYYADDQFTQEFQLLFNGDRIQGVAGLYYLDGHAEGAFDTILGQAGIVIGTAGSVDTKSYAAFADVSIDITDRFKVSVGARWTRDEKEGTVFRANYLGATRSPLLGGTPRAPLLVRSNYTNDKSFEKFTPRVSLSFDLTEDLTTYVSYGQGFKSGGFDMRGDVILTPQTVNGYEPETVDSYEIGLKGSLYDGRITFATALFKAEYKDQQVTTQVPAGASIASFVDNVGSSEMWGWEFEGRFRFTDNFQAGMALGYIDAEFNEFLRFYPAGATNPLTGTVVPPGGLTLNIADMAVFQNTPPWTMNFNATWDFDVAGGTLAITPMASYRDSFSMFEFAAPLLDQESYWLYDLSASWTAPSGNWKLVFTGKNLTDERYRIGGYNFPQSAGVLFGNSVTGFYGPPATLTFGAEVKF